MAQTYRTIQERGMKMNSKGIDCLGDNGVCIPLSSYSPKRIIKITRKEDDAHTKKGTELNGTWKQNTMSRFERVE